jgi:hypothetical protein
VIVGSRLAEALRVGGEPIQLLHGGEYWRFTVAAVARSGVGAVDSTRIYCQSKIAQRLLRKPYPVTMILYKLRDPETALELAHHFEQLFQHETRSWQEREESNLQLLLTLRVPLRSPSRSSFCSWLAFLMSDDDRAFEIRRSRFCVDRLQPARHQRDLSLAGALIAGLGSVIGCIIGGL